MRKSTSFASIPFFARTSSLGFAAPKGLEDDLRDPPLGSWEGAFADLG